MNKIISHLASVVIGVVLSSTVISIPQQLEIDILRAAEVRSAASEKELHRRLADSLDLGARIDACKQQPPVVRNIESPRRPAPPTPPSVKPIPLPPATESWQDQMLIAHNDWRHIVGVPSLKWSKELEQSAQQVADQIAVNSCKLEHSGSKNGESLHKSGAVRWVSGKTEHRPKTPAQILAAWGGEADNYRWIDNTCTGVCGHYTQVVWKQTTTVGCARARCGDSSDVAACQYSPAGNIQGEKPF